MRSIMYHNWKRNLIADFMISTGLGAAVSLGLLLAVRSSKFTPNDLMVFGICNVGLGLIVFAGVLLKK